MTFLRKVWDGIQAVLKFVGDVISTIILSVLYFTVFALFALPAKIFADFLTLKPRRSTFHPRVRQFDTLESFQHEG